MNLHHLTGYELLMLIKQTDHNLWNRRSWRHWAVALPLGAALVFVLPMLVGWSL